MEHQFKIGDKVKIPTQKTKDTEISLTACALIRYLPEDQDFCFISDITRHDEVVLGTRLDERASSFSINDIELYENNLMMYEIY